MEHSAFININILSKEAREELKVFYEFLLFKHRKQETTNTDNSHNKFNEFLSSSIKVKHFEMPGREERNER